MPLNCTRAQKTRVIGVLQTGNALLTAIFVIVVMSLLGAALVRMYFSQAESTVYEVYGAKAFQAAQVGVQMQLRAIFPLGATGGCDNGLQNIDLSSTPGFEACQVTATTCSTPKIEVDDPDTLVDPDIDYWVVTATGECRSVNEVEGQEPIITSRQVEVQVRRFN